MTHANPAIFASRHDSVDLNISADQSNRNAVTLAKAALAFDMLIVINYNQDGLNGETK
jgi:hypothetical protein